MPSMVQTFTFLLYVHHALASLHVQFFCTLQKFDKLLSGTWLIYFNIFSVICINEIISLICVCLLMWGRDDAGNVECIYVCPLMLCVLVAQYIDEISFDTRSFTIREIEYN